MPTGEKNNGQLPEDGQLKKEAEEIFSIHETTREDFLDQEKGKLKRIVELYGPTIDDLRLSLENLRKGSGNVSIHDEKAMRQYNRNMFDRDFLEDFLSNYENLSPEQKEQINADFKTLLEENDQ